MVEFGCLKDKKLCIGPECALFTSTTDCAPKSWALSLERIALASEKIAGAMEKGSQMTTTLPPFMARALSGGCLPTE